MSETLLQKAKKAEKPFKGISHKFPRNELEDLAVGWMTGEVSSKQVKNALGVRSGNYIYYMGCALRDAYRSEKIKLTQPPL